MLVLFVPPNQVINLLQTEYLWPLKIHVEPLASNVMVSGGEAFGR